jgi:hypothetical protein
MHDPPRVRPHLARALARGRHLVLELDGVVLDAEGVLGPDGRQDAVEEWVRSQPYRPRPLTALWGADPLTGLHYLAEREPDQLEGAERALAAVELDAAVLAHVNPGLGGLLAVAAASERVAVVTDLAEDAAEAALAAHGVRRAVHAVVGRRGADLSTTGAGSALERAAFLLGVDPGDGLYVTGSWARAWPVEQRGGATVIGCVCGRSSRKHLAADTVPVVGSVAAFARALAAQCAAER